jgi:hypothetical protein
MGKKSAYTGESAKDRSINLMDKFIKRNDNKNQQKTILPARRKDPNVPVNLWPFKDQIEYYDSRTSADAFDESYAAYSTWYSTVKQKSGVYHRTFDEFITARDLKPTLVEMWEQKTMPKDAVYQLRKLGVY